MRRRHSRKLNSAVPPGPAQHSRRGSWLAQAAITMTVLSILLTIASTALFRMYRQQTVMVERTFLTSTWLLLNRDFRHDLHAATSVTKSDDANQFELTTPRARIIWLTDGENVRRVVQNSDSPTGTDAVPAASLPGERYVFAEHTIRFLLTEGDNGTASVASIEVTPRPTSKGGVVAPNVAVATVGLDHRFVKRDATPEAQP